MDKQTILVVDDVPDNLDILSNVLSDLYRVQAAINGAKALEIAAITPAPDLILLDIMMPEMDGYEVLIRLKSKPSTAQIPVIFLSAKTETADEEKGLNLGALDYITKPFSPAIVLARVKTQLTLYNQSRALERSYLNLQKLEELRDNLVHMLVHDMRTPLSVMRMSLGMLKDEIADELNNENRLDLENALTGTEKLVEMVNDLLDISRMEAGKMPLNLVSNDVVKIARQAMLRISKLAEKINISLDIAEEQTIAICDPEIIDRVISNLLHNALKFTPEGGSVSVSIAKLETGVEVAITDSGPGIPEKFQQQIFEKFGQTEEARKHTSSGLGLTFSKMAVENHGGEIGVESESGNGSRFWFILPD